MKTDGKKLIFSLLWHQHQPYYKDHIHGTFQMPWVFLHAIKDYYEMAKHILEANEQCGSVKVKTIFNLVPSLLMQLKEYESVDVSDSFLILLRKPASALTYEEKHALLTQLCMVNRNTMAYEFPEFINLLKKYDNKHELAPAEILDASVLYLLSWTGVFFRKDKLPAKLIEKGHNFSEQEKLDLLGYYVEKIKEIVPLHAELEKKGMAELSFTPAFHPILPLLKDFSCTKESMPNYPMPELEANFGDDYKIHVDSGYEYYQKVFGKKPTGVWPAEGSVSPATADYYIKRGLKWAATDEDILARSLSRNIKEFPARAALYKNYRKESTDGQIRIYFRDKPLSDAIGFVYSTWNPIDAVKDFIIKLRYIYDNCDFNPHVSVILDGENAWEYYKNNAFDFFTLLYKELASTDWIEMQTFEESLRLQDEKLNHLGSGSWINGNFAIWCGHQEKNRGWELLSMTREDLMQKKNELPEELFENAFQELMVAEGSDWFWWYGDDHFTVQAGTFDQLFRGHLINIYRITGLKVPAILYDAIKKSHKIGLLNKPTRTLYPNLDGKNSSYFEWLGAGKFDLAYDEGSMHSGGKFLKILDFGYNQSHFCFRINCDTSVAFPDKLQLQIEINGISELFNLEKWKVTLTAEVEMCLGNSHIEGRITLNKIFNNINNADLVFVLKGQAEERAPRYNVIKLNHPTTEPIDWMV